MKPQEELLNQSSEKPGVITFPGKSFEGGVTSNWLGERLGSRRDSFR